ECQFADPVSDDGPSRGIFRQDLARRAVLRLRAQTNPNSTTGSDAEPVKFDACGQVDQDLLAVVALVAIDAMPAEVKHHLGAKLFQRPTQVRDIGQIAVDSVDLFPSLAESADRTGGTGQEGYVV